MKNTLAMGTALLVASTAPIFAQDNGASPCPTSDCCNECCPPKDPCAKCAQLWPSCGPDWIITPGAGPCTADGCDLFITAEFIYWAVRQDHMGFATTQLVSNPLLIPGEIIQPNWRMEPGFRVGIGWLTCIDGWDLYLNYTWLRPRTKNKVVRASSTITLANNISLYDVSSGVNGFSGVIDPEAGKWEVDFDVADFEWGRNFYISQCLHLRPHFGLKGGRLDQKFTRFATETISPTFNAPIITSRNEKNQIDYWFIGPRAGMDSAWHFTKCFSVIGEVAATALWGQYKLKNLSTQTGANGQISRLGNGFKTQWHSMKGVLEFLLGLRYEDWWCCDEYYTSFDIGWEVQWWGGQNQFIVGTNNVETRWGDLGFQGLTIRARFQF